MGCLSLWRYHNSRVCRQQPAKRQWEIRRPFNSFYLSMSVSPLPPGFRYFIRPPFYLYLTGLTFFLCHFAGEIQIIACRVVRLPVSGKVFNQELREGYVLPTQPFLMPYGKPDLLESSLCWFIQVGVPSFTVWIDEAAHCVIGRYCHGFLPGKGGLVLLLMLMRAAYV